MAALAASMAAWAVAATFIADRSLVDLTVPGLAEEGAVVFTKACELGLEDIVSKRAGSFYRSGKSRGWPKCLSTPAKLSDCDGCMVSTAHAMARLTAHTMATMAGPMIKPFMASPCA
jgi:hypothetical protein